MDLVVNWLASHILQIFAIFVLILCSLIAEGADWRNGQDDNQVNFVVLRFDFNFKIWSVALIGALVCWFLILMNWDPVKLGMVSEIASKNNFWLLLSQFVSIMLVIFSIPARHFWGAIMFITGTGLFLAIWKLVIVTSFGLR